MVFQGRFEGVVFMEFPSYFKDVSRVLQGSSMGILRRCQGCFMKSQVSMFYQAQPKPQLHWG